MACGTIRKVPRENLVVSKPLWWLETRFHFSFADYYHPDNVSFGALRVLNDDLVKPTGSFGRHPHRDAEIFTYVVQGELTHRSAQGEWEILGPGCIQYMTAGTGTIHEELNDGQETLRYIQVWLTPSLKGKRPAYGSLVVEDLDAQDRMLQVIQGNTGNSPSWKCSSRLQGLAKLQVDANAFVSKGRPGTSLELQLGAGRQAYLLCIEGSVSVAGAVLSEGDAVELQAPDSEAFPLSLVSGSDGSHALFIEMAKAEQ